MENEHKKNGIKAHKARQRRNRQKEKKVTMIAVCLCILVVAAGVFAGGKVVKTIGNAVSQGGNAAKKDVNIEKKEPIEVTISMVGDILTHTQVMKSGEKSDGTYNYDHLFKNVKEQMEKSDIAIANQEVILGGTEMGLSSYPSFNAPQEIGDALASSGFNTILHATNHTLDRGEKAVNNTMEFWKNKHPDVTVLGINETQEARDNIYIFEKEGFKIAVLNYTYGTNGVPVPSERPYLVNLLDEEKIDADLKKANELADFVVVCPHWGTEYKFEETEEQMKWADFFLKRGVDLIIGTHPHVIEPVKWVEDGENKMLVYYSLGNFVSRQDKWYTMVGGLANITVQKDPKGEVSIKDYGVEPLVTHIGSSAEDYTTYYLKDYTEELAKKNKITASYSEFSLEKCKELARDVFGELYKE